MGYIKRPKPKTNRELLAEDIAEARKYGLEYGEYRRRKEDGTLEDYIRHKFLVESQRNADEMITERSWIGQPHGRPTNKNAKWKKIQ